MSIKKVPVCPFCASEMEKWEHEAEIITGRAIKENLDMITSSQRLNMHACQKCGFVAFWSGKPQ